MRRSPRGPAFFTAFFLVLLSAHAGGSREISPPVLYVGADEAYISPAASPGVRDSLEIPVRVDPDAGNNRVISEYRLTISDASGRVVREWSGRKPAADGALGRFLVGLGLKKNEAVAVPRSIVWDGRSTGGTPSADGVYTYVFEAWDDSGLSSRSSPKKIVVDNTPPAARAVMEYRFFSPDGDDSMDSLPLRLSASEEAGWSAVFTDAAGAEAAAVDFGLALPSRYLWNGTGRDGGRLPDGEYAFRLTGVDRAGNVGTVSAGPVILDTKPRAFRIAASPAAFSPGAGRGGVKITPSGFVPDYFLEGSLDVVDENGAAVATLPFTGSFVDGIAFDGRDAGGKILPDGLYRFHARARYENGAFEEAVSKPVVVDTVPPSATLAAAADVFSPDGDGIKDGVDLEFSVTEPGTWKVVAADEKGKIAAEYLFDGTPPKKIRFDRRVPDGIYTFTAEGRDPAGNSFAGVPLRVTADTRPASIAVAAEFSAFSPDGDGVRDRIVLRPYSGSAKSVESYALTIKDAAGNPVRTIREDRRLPETVIWDGRNDAGEIVPDGKYAAEVRIRQINGKTAAASSPPFAVDTAAPAAGVALAAAALDIKPDGSSDGISILQTSDGGAAWTGEFVSVRTGSVVARKTWDGAVSGFLWDGLADSGAVVPDGEYRYRLTGEDEAGNRTTVASDGILVTSRKPAIRAVPSAAGFSPDGNGVRDAISFDLECSVPGGVSSWRLDLRNAKKEIAASLGGLGSPPPGRADWDGRGSDGGIVPDGVYTGEFSVAYGGKKEYYVPVEAIRVDTVPPAARLRLSPSPFSPDDDGRNDVLDIRLSVQDASPAGPWEIVISRAEGGEFTRFSGTGKIPDKIAWDGRNASGETVKQASDYILSYAVRDEAGNEARGEAPFVVDVLVYPGGKNRIRISAVQFAAWNADFLEWNVWHARVNTEILDEVAALLKKFPSYRIRLVGHAVAMLADDPVEAAHEKQYRLLPLSLGRSGAVRDALVERGIDGSRIETAGAGADEPVRPFSDEAMRWVNRRVEFFLLRK